MTQKKSSIFKFYFQSLTGVLGEPGTFFKKLPADIRLKQPVLFLIISGIFFSIASLLVTPSTSPFVTGSIFFINSVGMTFIAAGLGYMVMTMIIGKQVLFIKFFSIYAFSTGVILLASWVPTFFFITEPWKWWLIGTGLTKSCGLSWWHALLIIGISIIIMIIFFKSLSLLVF